MSDCINCWNGTCSCGFNYIGWEEKRIDELIDTLEVVKKFKKEKNIERGFYVLDHNLATIFNNYKHQLTKNSGSGVIEC